MTSKSLSAPDMRLSDELRLHMTRSAFDKTPKDFLPEGALESIVTRTTVCAAMGLTEPTREDSELVDYILTKARKVFATAAYIGLGPKALYKAMVLFRWNEFEDGMLPLEDITREQLLSEVHPLFKVEGPVPNGAKRIWNFRRSHDFVQQQWKFLAPIISTAESFHDFQARTLPFVKKHATRAEGAFGVISKYEIHSDHIQHPAKQDFRSSNIVAVKELKMYNESGLQEVARRWKSEVKAMAMMNTLDHKDHIVRFITAFRRGTPEAPEYYLIFEWADGGNLLNLWNQIPNPPLTTSFVKAIIKELRGLSEALYATHFLNNDGVYTGASWRHGDLKPANILWFPDGELGRLKISDWGESKSQQLATELRHQNTTAKFGTRRYEPPELEIGVGSMRPGQEDRRISRLYDIWSFGCITLEIIIWLLYGADGLLEFNKSLSDGSPFYQVDWTGETKCVRVHNVVAAWMDHISQDPACRAGTTALGDLLDLVKLGLLVVELPRHGGSFAEHNFLSSQTQPRNMWVEEHQKRGIRSHRPTPGSSLAQMEHRQDIPMITITPAGENETNNAATQPKFAVKVPGRYRADQLRDTLILIDSTDDVDSYWSTQRQGPIPRITSDLCSTSLSRCKDHEIGYGRPMVSSPISPVGVHQKPAAETFHTRGRAKGSKNKTTTQPRKEAKKTSPPDSASSRTPKTKRPRIGQGNSDDEGEKDDEEQSLQCTGSKEDSVNLNLACPFAKRIPLEYPQCRGVRFRDNGKVKEHLRKHHRIHCVRCGEAFHTEGAKDDHTKEIGETVICLNTKLDQCLTYMNVAQEVEISSYGQRNNPLGFWKTIYEILFPGHAAPDNPCYEEPEAQVFELIGEIHALDQASNPLNASRWSLVVFQAYQENVCAMSTCSARAALHFGRTITVPFQLEAPSTSDSGYGAAGEAHSARNRLGSSAQLPDAVSQENSQPGFTAAYESNIEVRDDADTHQNYVRQDTVGHANLTQNVEMQSENVSSDVHHIELLGKDGLMGGDNAALLGEELNSTLENVSDGLDLNWALFGQFG